MDNSICIVFLIACLNNLDFFAVDSTNEYLTVDVREKVGYIGGLETVLGTIHKNW